MPECNCCRAKQRKLAENRTKGLDCKPYICGIGPKIAVFVACIVLWIGYNIVW
jgi:hypothetical protein